MKKLHIGVNLSALRRTKVYEYALRFLFGGAITAFTGLLAKHYGASLGGLFLAFPAIFPATATLVEKHEKQKKQRAGLDGTIRGRQSAGVDAAGASLGSIGLVAFALIFWGLIPHLATWIVLLCATAAWMLICAILWYLRKTKFGLRSLLTRRHRSLTPARRR